MKQKCEECGREYDDEFFSTYCPGGHRYIPSREERQRMMREAEKLLGEQHE